MNFFELFQMRSLVPRRHTRLRPAFLAGPGPARSSTVQGIAHGTAHHGCAFSLCL